MAFMQLILQGGSGIAQAPPVSRPNQHVVHVSQEELDAITRLTALGFSQQRAARAFLSCDRNEELAANFLFEQAADDDDDALNQGIANSVNNNNGSNGTNGQNG